MDKDNVVIISGGFDPLHVGHVRMIQSAKFMGNYLIVIMNNDVWLKQKKGYVFMPENERSEIILAILGEQGYVISTSHQKDFTDRSVCHELKEIRSLYPNTNIIFANGGDRLADNVPEAKVCKELGIEMVFNVGGEKIQSSSNLVQKQKEKSNE